MRLKSLRSISEKAWIAISFDGTEAILPKSQVFGCDYSVKRSEAYWVSAWIINQKELQYSTKKEGWYNTATGLVEPSIRTVIERHVPTPIQPIITKADASLTRPAN